MLSCRQDAPAQPHRRELSPIIVVDSKHSLSAKEGEVFVFTRLPRVLACGADFCLLGVPESRKLCSEGTGLRVDVAIVLAMLL